MSSFIWVSTAVMTSFCIIISSSRVIPMRSSTSSTARENQPRTRRAMSVPRPAPSPMSHLPGGEALYVLVHTPVSPAAS